MLALRVALRYLAAPKSHRAVNIITFISMAGVAVATMAIIVVLSVFNGFSDLAKSHLSRIDPDFKVTAAKGKVFAGADSIAHALGNIDGIKAAAPSLQERGLLTAADTQMPVVFKGVSPEGIYSCADIDNLLIDGIYSPTNLMPDSCAGAQITVGVAIDMKLRPSPQATAELYVPRREGRINPANPAASYRSLPLAVTGVIRVDQPEYDADFMFIPLDKARELLEYSDGEASEIDIRLAPDASATKVRSSIEDALGRGFIVQNRMEQQADTFRMISIEKWVTFLMLVFILVIASFNIVSTLSLLVIEKRDNMATMRALGAPKSMITNIFITEGALITAIGGIIGAAIGIALSLIQQHFGLIKLSGDPSALTIDVYPVRLEWADVLPVVAAVAITGFLIAQLSRIFTRKLK